MFVKNESFITSTVTIIGGGIGGCITALRLAELNIPVILIEKNKLLSGTSNITPGRMGLGYHYFSHFSTAVKYLKATLAFAKKHPDMMLGTKEQTYLKQGRYFITKDSFVKPKTIIESTKQLKAIYARMVEQDPSNKLFGEPEDFFRVLAEKEYLRDVNLDKVALAIETQEQILNWPKFRQTLLSKIKAQKNITILENYKVICAEYKNCNNQYIVSAQNEFSNIDITSTYVVKCAWQDIEKINQTLNIHSNNETYSKRIKLIAEIELPKQLETKNSMFFCAGPHAMFTNLGNGLGKITFAPITNHYSSIDMSLPAKYNKWLDNGLSDSEQQYYGHKIMQGAANYIPSINQAKLLNVKAGVVVSQGLVDIYNNDSDFHRRDYSGVKQRHPGWIDNACMKLFYCEDNAEEIIKIIHSQDAIIYKNYEMPNIKNIFGSSKSI